MYIFRLSTSAPMDIHLVRVSQYVDLVNVSQRNEENVPHFFSPCWQLWIKSIKCMEKGDRNEKPCLTRGVTTALCPWLRPRCDSDATSWLPSSELTDVIASSIRCKLNSWHRYMIGWIAGVKHENSAQLNFVASRAEPRFLARVDARWCRRGKYKQVRC